MKQSWIWIAKYLVVIAIAMVLGSVLAGLEPFKSTTIGTSGIGAGALVQFIAHGGALALLWAMGYRIAGQLRLAGGPTKHLSATALALITLVVVASAYGVLWRLITPVLASDLKPALDWVFIVGILTSALWLLWVLFTDSEAVIAAVGGVAAAGKKEPPPLDDRVAP